MIPIALGLSLFNYVLIVMSMVEIDFISTNSWLMYTIFMVMFIINSMVLWRGIKDMVHYFKVKENDNG